MSIHDFTKGQGAPSELGRLRARFVTDQRGTLREANVDACVMMDLGRRFLVGRNLGLFIERAHAPKLKKLIESVSAGRPSVSELSVRNRVGRAHPVRIEGVRMPDDTIHWTARLREATAA